MSLIRTPKAIQRAKQGPFSHRINGQTDTPHPADLLSQPIKRALALADLLETLTSEADTSATLPETLNYTAQSISYELQDALALIGAVYASDSVENRD